MTKPNAIEWQKKEKVKRETEKKLVKVLFPLKEKPGAYIEIYMLLDDYYLIKWLCITWLLVLLKNSLEEINNKHD